MRSIFHLETLIYTKKLTGETLILWLALPPSWTTACPHVSTKETALELEIVFSRLECLTSTRLHLQPCSVKLLTMRARLAILSDSSKWNEKVIDSWKVKGQPNIDHIKWACRNYRLTPLKIILWKFYPDKNVPSFFIWRKMKVDNLLKRKSYSTVNWNQSDCLWVILFLTKVSGSY